MQKKTYIFSTIFSLILFISFAISTVSVSANSLVLKQGMSGSKVSELQKTLNAMGFLGTTPTGYFGEQTKAAVIKLQASYKLKEDGIAGQAVFSVINKPAAKNPGKDTPTAQKDSDKADLGQRIVNTAKEYIGTPYVWGKADPGGFDSSGLIWYVYGKNGIKLPRTSSSMFKKGTPISRDKLLPGDVVFFQGYAKGPSHATIYAGEGNFAHSPSTGKTVSFGRLLEDKYYWSARYFGARRYSEGE